MEHLITYSVFQQTDEVEKLFSEKADALNKYLDQLLWWNKRVNLVSRDVSRETLRLHVEHSISLYFSPLVKGAQRIIDAGSGGGLPGIPLGIVYPEKQVVLNDIVSKKMMASKQMILKMELDNVSVQNGSIEGVERVKSDLVISKHAFKINDLVGLLSSQDWENVVLLKGAEEIEKELNGIDAPLKINVCSLEAFDNSFYDGKAIVEITKRKDE